LIPGTGRPHHADLEHHEPDDEAAQGTEGLHRVVLGETDLAQQPERGLGRSERRRRHREALGLRDEHHDVGVSPQDLSPRPRGLPCAPFPIAVGPRIQELGEHPLADPQEQIFLVVHVVVERHRLHAELAADPAHRHGVEALLVHDPQRRVDHAVAR
jgi:hypothetical protein